MIKRTGNGELWERLKDSIVGLGERSIRKNYYPALKGKIRDLDQQCVFFQSILNSIPEGVLIRDSSGRIIQGNPAFCRMFGYPNEELAGLDPDLLYEPSSQVFQHHVLPTAWCRRFVRKDGVVFLGETLDSEIRDEHGVLLGYLEVIRELTEEIAMLGQKKQMEEHLRQSQKMAAIGTLAGGIAHDFNNLPAAIMGYAELALLKLPPESIVNREIEQILVAGGKAAELVNQILAFSRKETTQRILLQPGALLKEALKLLRGSIPSTITIHEQILATDRLIFANPTQLHQVVMNLCTNASHAMEGQGGDLTLGLDIVEKSGIDAEGVREYIRIIVADSGAGIDPATLDRIFEPYYTTKPSGKGTGMGLAVVHGIVKNHEGRIEVESEPGTGTVFKVYFPVISGEEAPQSQARAANLVGGSESILVVDDEQMVTDYLKGFLEQLGYRIMVCNDGLRALAVFEQHPNRFDLVITDQTMPGKTGFDLACAMLARRPDLPIILCSGYSSALSSALVTGAGIREFLMKPVSMQELAPLIRRILDAS